MSITGIINNNLIPEINLFLRETIPERGLFRSMRYLGAFGLDRNIIAPYNLPSVGYASVSGTAFDYLARFEVAKVIEHNKNDCLNVIAEYAIPILWELGYRRECKESIKNYEWSMAVVEEYIHGKGSHSDSKLIDICCFLARLEHLVRSNSVEVELINKPADALLKEDLGNMLMGFRKNFISGCVEVGSHVIFNPKFNCYAGADADICIDGTLYDFKTCKFTGFKWQEVAQIWAYFLLHEIDNKNMELGTFPRMSIDRIALYKARVADVDYIDIEDVNDLDENIMRMQYLLEKYRVYIGFDYNN